MLGKFPGVILLQWTSVLGVRDQKHFYTEGVCAIFWRIGLEERARSWCASVRC